MRNSTASAPARRCGWRSKRFRFRVEEAAAGATRRVRDRRGGGARRRAAGAGVGLTPTTRCAAIVAAAAASAIVLPLGVSVAVLVVVLGASLADGFSVRRAPRVRRTLDTSLSRSEPVALTVRALPADAREVLLRQPATSSL